MKEAYSADETPAAQRKVKVTMTFNAPGVFKNEGGGAAMEEEGLEVRDVRRAIAQNAESERSRDGGGRSSEDRAGEVSGEAVARPAVCSAEVMERLRIMARSSVVAARMLANGERNRQLSRGGCCAVVAAGTGSPAREASCRRALPRRNGQPRWGRLLRRRAQRRASHLPCPTEGKPNASALTVTALKRHCPSRCGVEQWQTQSRPSRGHKQWSQGGVDDGQTQSPTVIGGKQWSRCGKNKLNLGWIVSNDVSLASESVFAAHWTDCKFCEQSFPTHIAVVDL